MFFRRAYSSLLRGIMLCVMSCATLSLHAQVAGLSTLAVLEMPASPVAASLGMDFVALPQGSLSLSLDNPSLLTPDLSQQAALGYIGIPRGSNFGTLSYGHSFNNVGTFAYGIRFCSYGHFEGFSEEDVSTGSFSAADYVFSVGWGRAIDSNFYFGATFKPTYSHYESYNALALVFDVAASFVSDDHLFAATIIGRNIGAQILTFDNSVEHIPFQISAGLSYKLRNAPFRFYFNAVNLQRWDYSYDDPLNPSSTTDPFTGAISEPSKASAFFDRLGRHAQMGVELNIGKSFFARLGYNYRQAREMHAADVLNVSGLAFGLGLSFRGFEFTYSHNNYHHWQGVNYIAVSTNLDRFFLKNNVR